jgi:hypothetical protein
MSNTNAYIAKRTVNLNFLMGNFIDDLTFTILDADGAAFDFSGADSLALRIYSNRTTARTLIDTWTTTGAYPWSTGGDMTQASGVITVNTAFPSGMTFGQYNYELDYIDSESTPDGKRLAEGTITVK